MAEIKQFKLSTKDKVKLEKPTDVETDKLMKTVSHMIQKIFEESGDKRGVVEQLRNLADNLEQKLKK